MVRERLISRGFKVKGNITITTWRTLRDTNEISRKGANVSESKGQLMTAGSERIKGWRGGKGEVPPVDEMDKRGCRFNEMQGGAPVEQFSIPNILLKDIFVILLMVYTLVTTITHLTAIHHKSNKSVGL